MFKSRVRKVNFIGQRMAKQTNFGLTEMNATIKISNGFDIHFIGVTFINLKRPFGCCWEEQPWYESDYPQKDQNGYYLFCRGHDDGYVYRFQDGKLLRAQRIHVQPLHWELATFYGMTFNQLFKCEALLNCMEFSDSSQLLHVIDCLLEAINPVLPLKQTMITAFHTQHGIQSPVRRALLSSLGERQLLREIFEFL